MNPDTLKAILSVVSFALPFIKGVAGATGPVGSIITILAEAAPLAVKAAQDVAPMVKNIIAALKANGAVTPEQWAALDALEKQIDADFDAAANAAEAEDKA